MQVLAMLTMLIDHVGIVFFPENPWFRYIGRLAMPLYAYALALGYLRTRDFRRYALRLAAVAAVSQLPYRYALMEPDEPFEFNVVFTLLVSLLILRLIDAAVPSDGHRHEAAAASASADNPRRAAPPASAGIPGAGAPPRSGSGLRRMAAPGIAASGCVLLELVPCDYGSHLLLLVLIYRFLTEQQALMAHFFLNLAYIWLGFPPYQMFGLLSTLLAACAPSARDAMNRRFRAPRWLWRSFYPAHLAVLAAFRHLAPF